MTVQAMVDAWEMTHTSDGEPLAPLDRLALVVLADCTDDWDNGARGEHSTRFSLDYFARKMLMRPDAALAYLRSLQARGVLHIRDEQITDRGVTFAGWILWTEGREDV